MFLDESHIRNVMGFKKVGANVKISDKAVFYNAGNISIGNNCRIDDFAILSAGVGGIEIGDYVHIGCFASILGKALVRLCDYSALSPRVSIYSSTDNYDGEYMTNPCIPDKFRRPIDAAVHLGRHVIIGTNSVILPGVVLKDGCCVWSMSLVNISFEPNKVVYGIPAKVVKERKLGIYEQEKLLLENG